VHRHDLDPVALVFGATFVAIGLAYAIARWSWTGSAHGWVLGVFLIVLGVAGAVSATTRDRKRVDRTPITSVEPTNGTEPKAFTDDGARR
jgi:hypothetical protein